MIVALDGPAASGKGTIARRLAQRYGYAHLDTGLLYRAVARHLIDEHGGRHERAAAKGYASGLAPDALDGASGLRTPEVDSLVSAVAAWPEVREEALVKQREFASNPPGGAAGAVLDGRDIGTVVCPDADVKVYVTADLEERARRRMGELERRGVAADPAQVQAAMAKRDEQDSGRELAPMLRAEDAHLLDTTKLGIEEAVDRVAALIAECLDVDRGPHSL